METITIKQFDREVFRKLKHNPAKDALLISLEIWAQILCDDTFIELFVPVSDKQIVKDGCLGSLDGLPLYTDSFRKDKMLKEVCAYLAPKEEILKWLSAGNIPEGQVAVKLIQDFF